VNDHEALLVGPPTHPSPGGPTRVAIALGSNLGDREAHLRYAVDRLSAVLTAVRVSPFIETEPQGVGPQPRFLNGALVGGSQLNARDLLGVLQTIERERGRERPHVGAPRTLDLDLVLFGAEVVDQPGLTVPHPRFRERAFVLQPLAAIAPEMIDPVTRLTVRELLRRVTR
jgi:2-amino-4-hydroxy-6-hydroxymethyldihydropteridine diphosphokinase